MPRAIKLGLGIFSGSIQNTPECRLPNPMNTQTHTHTHTRDRRQPTHTHTFSLTCVLTILLMHSAGLAFAGDRLAAPASAERSEERWPAAVAEAVAVGPRAHD